MYIEDDILVPYKSIKYWLEYNEKLIKKGFNLSFIRSQIDKDNIEYITDLYGEKFDTIIKLNNNSYCAFWIYNKMNLIDSLLVSFIILVLYLDMK